jgi:hypothetical protein
MYCAYVRIAPTTQSIFDFFFEPMLCLFYQNHIGQQHVIDWLNCNTKILNTSSTQPFANILNKGYEIFRSLQITTYNIYWKETLKRIAVLVLVDK